jgi:hypothetical protein
MGFCETTNRYFGLAPPGTRHSDMVCVLNGYSMFAILRREGDQILFVGSCFILGFMSGEEVKGLVDARRLEVRTLRIS